MEIQIHIFNEREGTLDHSETACCVAHFHLYWYPSIHVLASVFIPPRLSSDCGLVQFIVFYIQAGHDQ